MVGCIPGLLVHEGINCSSVSLSVGTIDTIKASISGFISLQNFKTVRCFSILIFTGCDEEFPQFNEGFTDPRLCKPW